MKTRNLFVVICTCIFSMSLCACAHESEEVNNDGVEAIESVDETTEEVTTKNTAEIVEETVAVEATEESVSEENISGPQSVGEQATSLDTTEPKLLVWNDETGTREVIDEGGEYHMQEGDILAGYYGDI